MDDRAKVLAKETVLKQYGLLVDQHSQTLDRITRWPPHKGEDGQAAAPSSTISDVASNVPDVPLLLPCSEAYEGADLLEIVCSDNKMLSKVVLALASVCSEMRDMVREAEERFFCPLLLYGSGVKTEEGGKQLALSRVLPLLRRMAQYQRYCQKVLANTMRQMSVLHADSKSASPRLISIADTHFQVVFDHVGRLLTTLLTLDSLLLSQQQNSVSASSSSLSSDWSAYKVAVKAARANPDKFELEVNDDEVGRLEECLEDIDGRLFRTGMFAACVDQDLDSSGGEETVAVGSNKCLRGEALVCLRTTMADVESSLVTAAWDPLQRLRVVDLSCLVIYFAKLFGLQDKRVLTRLWELFKKVPNVTLTGNILWFPEHVFSAHLPDHFGSGLDKRLPAGVAAARKALLEGKAQSLPQDVKAYQRQLSTWMNRLETSLRRPGGSLSLDELHRKADLILQGLKIACSLRNLASNLLNLHSKLSAPLTKSSAVCLCRMLQMLKCVEQLFFRHSLLVSDAVAHVTQHTAFLVVSTVERAKRGVASDGRMTQSRVDTLAAMAAAEAAVAGPPTHDRRTVARICLSLAAQNRTFRDEEIRSLSSNLHRIAVLGSIQKSVRRACDCSFAYWHRAIVPIYFEHVYENKSEAPRLHYLFLAMGDSASPLSSVQHLENNNELREAFQKEIESYFKDEILDPLCRHLETDLRMHAHSHLHLDDVRNPFKESAGTTNRRCLSPLLELGPIRFLDKYIHVKTCVLQYLNRTFYNLATVAMHNWRTYAEMRSLADHKHGLPSLSSSGRGGDDDHLPVSTHTAEETQGPDALEIMRHLDAFVRRYRYNANDQVFVERPQSGGGGGGDAKYLSTVGVSHVSNSVRCHGAGILNTAANNAYQLLRKRFASFSRFLNDDRVKSRLLRDAKHFADSREALEHKFPYDRASKFVKVFRRVEEDDGASASTFNYMEDFRKLVSEIGNALGFVRLVRTAGLRNATEAVAFLPQSENNPFGALSVGGSEEVSRSASLLDETMASMGSGLDNEGDFLQMLVAVFGKQLRDSTNFSHLDNFFLLVPALSVAHAEHMVIAKDVLVRKGWRKSATSAVEPEIGFTDDGLTMGIAYLLTLLKQWSQFDSLHWFQSVGEKYTQEKAKIEKQSNQEGGEEKLQQTLALTARRLDVLQKEFDLIFYGLSSARIFFRESPDDLTLDSAKNALSSELLRGNY